VAMGFAGLLLLIPGMITDLAACIIVTGPSHAVGAATRGLHPGEG
jgi:UPF0716 family protein affecting phage T7 exclusion